MSFGTAQLVPFLTFFLVINQSDYRVFKKEANAQAKSHTGLILNSRSTHTRTPLNKCMHIQPL